MLVHARAYIHSTAIRKYTLPDCQKCIRSEACGNMNKNKMIWASVAGVVLVAAVIVVVLISGTSSYGASDDERTYGYADDALASGVPGSAMGPITDEPTMVIRGAQSFNGNTLPLWVICGVPFASGYSDGQIVLQDMQVLKDASSTAIYGQRELGAPIILMTENINDGNVVSRGTSMREAVRTWSDVLLNSFVGLIERIPVTCGYDKGVSDADGDFDKRASLVVPGFVAQEVSQDQWQEGRRVSLAIPGFVAVWNGKTDAVNSSLSPRTNFVDRTHLFGTSMREAVPTWSEDPILVRNSHPEYETANRQMGNLPGIVTTCVFDRWHKAMVNDAIGIGALIGGAYLSAAEAMRTSTPDVKIISSGGQRVRLADVESFDIGNVYGVDVVSGTFERDKKIRPEIEIAADTQFRGEKLGIAGDGITGTDVNWLNDWMGAIVAVAEDPTWVLDYLKPGFGVSVNGLN